MAGKIAKDEALNNLIRCIREKNFHEINFLIARIWEQYLKSSPKLLEFSKEVVNDRIFNDNERYYCLSYGASIFWVEFFTELNLMVYKDEIKRENIREMKFQFRADVSGLLYFGELD